MDNTRTVTDAKQQKIKIKKDVITSSMSTIVDRTCYVFYFGYLFSDPLYLHEQNCGDWWLFFEAKTVPRAEKFGKHWPHMMKILLNAMKFVITYDVCF
jgi:hypothetical protein